MTFTVYLSSISVVGIIHAKKIKHLAHCCALLTFLSTVIFLLISVTNLKLNNGGLLFGFNPWVAYGTFGCAFLYFLRLLAIFAVPHTVLNFLGLICFNIFPGDVALKGSPLFTPLICIRIVTRGDFPRLVRENVARNMTTCTEEGLKNFLIEVVTDKEVGLPSDQRIREIVIPPSYETKSGALYKARALQYCLEYHINILKDTDYIVHLDEETIMTGNSVRGIINFVLDGKYDFGQGLITYANGRVVNWITTLADSFRVADDIGKLRAQFYFFHKPLLSWKGSFIVSKVGTRKLLRKLCTFS